MSSSREKSPKQGENNESPKVQGASERAKEENIHTSDKIEKIHENAAVEREITKKSGSMKIPDLVSFVKSVQNYPFHKIPISKPFAFGV